MKNATGPESDTLCGESAVWHQLNLFVSFPRFHFLTTVNESRGKKRSVSRQSINMQVGALDSPVEVSRPNNS